MQSGFIQNQEFIPVKDELLGLRRGSIFENLYIPYKKEVNINVTNERQRRALEVQKYTFWTIDTGLYLDNHPNDIKAIETMNKLNTLLSREVNAYENMYGPITMNSLQNNRFPYGWIEGPWPWENDK